MGLDGPVGPEDDGAAVNGPEITAPEAWDLVGRDIVSFVVNHGRVVVISAHPDDETLAIGGLLQSLHRAGARLEMVIATDGEAAFPSLGPDQRAALGRCRRAEMQRRSANWGSTMYQLPGWVFPTRPSAKTICLRRSGRSLPRPICAWRPGPKIRTLTIGPRASPPALRPCGTEVWGYPIWTWAWENPGTVSLPWSRAARHRLDEGERRRKDAAISSFPSQAGPRPFGGAAYCRTRRLRPFQYRS